MLASDLPHLKPTLAALPHPPPPTGVGVVVRQIPPHLPHLA